MVSYVALYTEDALFTKSTILVQCVRFFSSVYRRMFCIFILITPKVIIWYCQSHQNDLLVDGKQ